MQEMPDGKKQSRYEFFRVIRAVSTNKN